MAADMSKPTAKRNALYDAQVKMDLLSELTLLEEIRGDLQAQNIQLPGIVVCGGQSAGKGVKETLGSCISALHELES